MTKYGALNERFRVWHVKVCCVSRVCEDPAHYAEGRSEERSNPIGSCGFLIIDTVLSVVDVCQRLDSSDLQYWRDDWFLPEVAWIEGGAGHGFSRSAFDRHPPYKASSCSCGTYQGALISAHGVELKRGP